MRETSCNGPETGPGGAAAVTRGAGPVRVTVTGSVTRFLIFQEKTEIWIFKKWEISNFKKTLETKKTTEKEVCAKENSHGPNPCPRPETSAACWHCGPRLAGRPALDWVLPDACLGTGTGPAEREDGLPRQPQAVRLCPAPRLFGFTGNILFPAVPRLKNKEPPGDQRFFR